MQYSNQHNKEETKNLRIVKKETKWSSIATNTNVHRNSNKITLKTIRIKK